MPFPLYHRTVHLCVDMQRLFAEPSPWHVPWMPRIMPEIVALAERCPARTIFSRFIPPETAEDASGAWRDYYTQWRAVTREHLDPRLLELAPPLAALVPPARIIDKPVYSALSQPSACKQLKRNGVTTLIVTGGETDVCVLSTVMDALDAGFRVILPIDALCSVRDQTHEALLTLYRERFSLQMRRRPRGMCCRGGIAREGQEALMEEVHYETLEEAATHATDEARMILPGVQAIMGFQLIAVFNQRFESLEPADQAVHLTAFFLITVAMGLLMTPAAYHRLAERGSVTKRFVKLASGVIAVALLPLLIGLALDSYILVRLVIHDRTASIAIGVAVTLGLAAMWFGLPLLGRRETSD